MSESRLLENKVALVAGASRGIGAATAKALASAGAKVMLAARDERALRSVLDEIQSQGHDAAITVADVGDERSVENLIDRTIATFGRLDVAFNNATDGSMPAPIVDTDPADFDRAIRTNIRGTFLGMKYQLRAMLESGGGAIVNMASVAGLQGVANLAGYVAGKAGIIALTKVAALENADRNIRVNVLVPGPILTHHLEAAGAEAQRQAAASTPMGRLGTVEDVANAVVWLASDQSGYVTGIALPIDGAQSAGMKPRRMYRPGEAMSGAAS